MNKLSKVEKIEDLQVTSLAFGGDGVVRRENGKVCFLPAVIPGEKVRVRITEEKKNYSYGKVLAILEKAPERLPEESCPANCPGCPYRMMDYALELEWKMKQLVSFVQRLKKMTVKNILPPTGADNREYWRNKITLQLTENSDPFSYVARDNHTLIPVKKCPIAAREINEAMQEAAEKRRWEKGSVKITFRKTVKDGVVFFTDRTKEKKILTETLGDYGDFQVEQRSFFQINSFMAAKLSDKYLHILKKIRPEHILELYCGCGVFSILAAEYCRIPCYGIELDKESVLLAGKNAALHHVEDLCKFYAGDAGKKMKEYCRKKPLQYNGLLLVDPPRTGLDANASSLILEAGERWMIYISCNPASLMRDLDILAAKYEVEEMSLFDLFPSTGHFETFTLLKRKELCP